MPFRLGDLVSVVASIGAVTLALVVIDQRSEIESIRSKVEAIQMQMQSMAAASKRLQSEADSSVAAVANGHLTPPVAFTKAGADGGAATVASGHPVQPDAVMKAGMGFISPGFAESAPLNPPADAGVAVKSERPPQQAAFLQAIREAHLRNMQAQPPTPGVSASPFGQPPNEAKKN